MRRRRGSGHGNLQWDDLPGACGRSTLGVNLNITSSDVNFHGGSCRTWSVQSGGSVLVCVVWRLGGVPLGNGGCWRRVAAVFGAFLLSAVPRSLGMGHFSGRRCVLHGFYFLIHGVWGRETPCQGASGGSALWFSLGNTLFSAALDQSSVETWLQQHRLSLCSISSYVSSNFAFALEHTRFPSRVPV
jgi:hypothetical protein